MTPLTAPASHTEFPGCSTERDKAQETLRVEKTEQLSRKIKGARVCTAEYHSREKCSERKLQRFAKHSPQVSKSMVQKKKRINNNDQRVWGRGEEREKHTHKNREKSMKAKVASLKSSIKFTKL